MTSALKEKYSLYSPASFATKKVILLAGITVVNMLIFASLFFPNSNYGIGSPPSIWGATNMFSSSSLSPFFFSRWQNQNKIDDEGSVVVEIIMENFHSMPKVVNPLYSFNSKNFNKEIANQFARNLGLKTKIHSNSIDRNDFEKWIQQQLDISLQSMKANIADNNLNSNTQSYLSRGMIEGIVFASPSAQDPNYLYDWTRDTAITMNTIVNALVVDLENEDAAYLSGAAKACRNDMTLFGTVLKYMNRTFTAQRTENLSGGFLNDDLRGFGEPKWEVNGHSYQGSWGRPQNDGPALRATTFLRFLKMIDALDYSFEHIFECLEPVLLNRTSLVFASEKDFYEKVLYYDLKFVVQNWNMDSFDLWEELNGKHFFTSLVQLNALKFGIDFLEKKQWDSPDGSSYTSFLSQLTSTYDSLLYFITHKAGFQDGFTNYIIENPQYKFKRSGLDIATLIATVLTHDPISDEIVSTVPFNYNHSLVLNSLHELCKQMSVLYPINHNLKSPELGVSLGRYPEDIYNGNGESEGNPWFLATSTGAQLIYGYVNLHLKAKMDLVLCVSPVNWAQTFWSTFFILPSNLYDGNIEYNLIIPYGTPLYIQTLNNMMIYADSFLDQVRQHVSNEGNMAEQFNKYTGFQQGARDLTWSYGTFWNTATLRFRTQRELNNVLM